MKSLSNTLKNNIWYIVIGATLVVAGAGIAITKPWETYFEVGTWEVYRIQAFNTDITASIYIGDESQAAVSKFNKASSLSDKIVDEYHCSFTNKDKDLNDCGLTKNILGLNRTMNWFEVSKTVYDAVNYGIEMNKKTDGYFSIAQGKIISLWKDNLIDKKGPTFTEQNALDALSYIESKIDDYKNIQWDKDTLATKEENKRYYVQRKSNVIVDLGGIAKAILTDKLKSIFSERGYTRFTINSGGSSWTTKGKIIGKSGKIAVYNPLYIDECGTSDGVNVCDTEINGQYYKALEIDATDISLGTSGDYADNNYIDVAGKRYHHIINPMTGRPAEGVRSTTIVTESAAESDVWSTALMARGLDEAKKFFAANPDIVATFYDGVGKKTEITQKAKDSGRIKVCTNATDC